MVGRLKPNARTPDWHAVPSTLTPTEFAFGHGDENAEFIAEHCSKGDYAVNGEYIATPHASVAALFDPRDDPKEAVMVYYFEDPADAIVFKMKIAG